MGPSIHHHPTPKERYFKSLQKTSRKAAVPDSVSPSRANRSVVDAVIMAPHFILQHQYSLGTYARSLFVDFSSAFNTIHLQADYRLSV